MGRGEGWACPLASSSRQPARALPTTPPQILALRVEFLTCTRVHGGWWWGTVFGSWNQPEIMSAKHTAVPDYGHCSLGPADSLELQERALSWVLTSPLHPLPLQTLAGPWPGSEPPAHPVWPTLSICPTSQSRQLAARQGRAHVSGLPPGEGREQRLQRGLQSRRAQNG